MKLQRQNSYRSITAGALAVGMAAFAATQLSASSSAAAEGTPPISVEVLLAHSTFPDEVTLKLKRTLSGQGTDVLNVGDPGSMVVARITLQPGAKFPWHTHPGPVVVSVAQGVLVYQQASDCVERTYDSHESFVEPGPLVHTAWNAGSEPTVLVGIFYDVPAGGAVTIPSANQSERCA